MLGLGIVVALLLVAAFAPLIATADPLRANLDKRLLPPSAGQFLRHGFARPRYLQPHRLRHPRHAGHRDADVVITVGAGRPADRRGLGLSRRLGRSPADAHHRRLPGLPEPGAGARLRRRARPRLENAIIAIAITAWPPIARVARAETLIIRQQDYIAAVRLQGASQWRIVWKHVVPMCLPSLIVRITLDMAGIILTAAGLGFLGLGAQPPIPEWGAMISAGREQIFDQWWVATFPGLAICVVSLGFNLLGDGCATSSRGMMRAMTSHRTAAARTRQSPGHLPHADRHRARGARPLLHARPRAARHRRRIRLRQVDDRPRRSSTSSPIPARSSPTGWSSRQDLLTMDKRRGASCAAAASRW
jgi:peptide/nickel transport system permease protein